MQCAQRFYQVCSKIGWCGHVQAYRAELNDRGGRDDTDEFEGKVKAESALLEGHKDASRYAAAGVRNRTRAIALIKDYQMALQDVLEQRRGREPRSTSATHAIVKQLWEVQDDGTGALVVIRLTQTSQDYVTKFQKQMIQLQRSASSDGLCRFAVLVSAGTSSLDKQLKEHHEKKEGFIHRLRAWRGEPAQITEFEPKMFADLGHLPCLLIIVDQGKMGDTFPQNLIAWDLRARYDSNSFSRTTFIQDAGRVFGWRYRKDASAPRLPRLLLGEKAYLRFANNDWKHFLDGNLKKRQTTTPKQSMHAAVAAPETSMPADVNDQLRQFFCVFERDAMTPKWDQTHRKCKELFKQYPAAKIFEKEASYVWGYTAEFDPGEKETKEYVHLWGQCPNPDSHGPEFVYFKPPTSPRADWIRVKDLLHTKSHPAVRKAILDCGLAKLEENFDFEPGEEKEESLEYMLAKLSNGFLQQADNTSPEPIDHAAYRKDVKSTHQAKKKCILSDENNHRFYTNNTILLTAQPQIGKTGTFIDVIQRAYAALPYRGEQIIAITLKSVARNAEDLQMFWDSKRSFGRLTGIPYKDIRCGEKTTYQQIKQQIQNICGVRSDIPDGADWPDLSKIFLVVEDLSSMDAHLPIREEHIYHPGQLRAMLEDKTIVVEIGDDGAYFDENTKWNSRSRSDTEALYAQVGATDQERYRKSYNDRCRLWDLQGVEPPAQTIAKDIVSKNRHEQFLAKGQIIDLGCGDMLFAKKLKEATDAQGHQCVFGNLTGIDLSAPGADLPKDNGGKQPRFIEGDIATLPKLLKEGSHCGYHVVVMCLSLLGTDWSDMLVEGYQLAAVDGYVYIALTRERHCELDMPADTSKCFLENVDELFSCAVDSVLSPSERFKIYRITKKQKHTIQDAMVLKATARKLWQLDEPGTRRLVCPVFPVVQQSTFEVATTALTVAPSLGNGAYPDYQKVSGLEFEGRGTLTAGKYGPPSENDRWDWYVTNSKRGRYQLAGGSDLMEVAAASVVPSSSGANVLQPQYVFPETARYISKSASSGTVAAAATPGHENTPTFTFSLGGETLHLDVPPPQRRVWITEGNGLPPRCAFDEMDCKFLIAIPSAGRHDTGLLDLSEDFPPRVRYNQIVAVKPAQLRDYRRHWPNLTFLVLPESVEGVGASRHWIQRFAASATARSEWPHCFVLDDSVQYWKGVTLKNDPLDHAVLQEMFGGRAESKQHTKAGFSDLQLWHVLNHFQKPLFKSNLQKFALLGFGRHNPLHTNISNAYKRSHVYSAVLLNLSWLQQNDVWFNPHLFVWEDLEFNERVNSKGGVICKCQRFTHGKRQFSSGGCTLYVVSADSTPAHHPGKPFFVHNMPPHPWNRVTRCAVDGSSFAQCVGIACFQRHRCRWPISALQIKGVWLAAERGGVCVCVCVCVCARVCVQALDLTSCVSLGTT